MNNYYEIHGDTVKYSQISCHNAKSTEKYLNAIILKSINASKVPFLLDAFTNDVLIRCSLPINQCRGQAYDGASNMSGINNRVQALFKAEAKQALYVHCLAHSLNLCLKDVTNTCKIIRDVLNFIYEFTQLIKMSPKRLTLFESLRREVTINTGELTPCLRMLCPTHWTVNHSSIASILKNYGIIQSALEEIS